MSFAGFVLALFLPDVPLKRTSEGPVAVGREMAIDPRVDIGHVHLKVSDIERALGFYRDVLGFEEMQRYGDQAAFISAGGYHHHLGLNTWESKGGSPPPHGTTGLYHVAIRYPDRKTLAQAREGSASRPGVPLGGASDHGVSEAIYLRDPDENGIELYRDRPRGGVAARRGRQRVAMVIGAARPRGAPRRSGVTDEAQSAPARSRSSCSVVASLFCVALVLVRNVHTGNANFRYLIWNLFLAWIPFAARRLRLRPLASPRRRG